MNVLYTGVPTKVWLYVPLWIFYVYLYSQIISFSVETNQNLFVAGLYLIEFGVHEVSHIMTIFLPPVFTALAGSVGEIFFTLLVIFAALRQRSYFAAIFGVLWCMLAMNSVGRYIADARSQLLPLVGPGETVTHDWHFILGQWGMLSADTAIGMTVRVFGDVLGLLALLIGLWLIIRMFFYIEIDESLVATDKTA